MSGGVEALVAEREEGEAEGGEGIAVMKAKLGMALAKGEGGAGAVNGSDEEGVVNGSGEGGVVNGSDEGGVVNGEGTPQKTNGGVHNGKHSDGEEEDDAGSVELKRSPRKHHKVDQGGGKQESNGEATPEKKLEEGRSKRSVDRELEGWRERRSSPRLAEARHSASPMSKRTREESGKQGKAMYDLGAALGEEEEEKEEEEEEEVDVVKLEEEEREEEEEEGPPVLVPETGVNSPPREESLGRETPELVFQSPQTSIPSTSFRRDTSLDSTDPERSPLKDSSLRRISGRRAVRRAMMSDSRTQSMKRKSEGTDENGDCSSSPSKRARGSPSEASPGWRFFASTPFSRVWKRKDLVSDSMVVNYSQSEDSMQLGLDLDEDLKPTSPLESAPKTPSKWTCSVM